MPRVISRQPSVTLAVLIAFTASAAWAQPPAAEVETAVEAAAGATAEQPAPVDAADVADVAEAADVGDPADTPAAEPEAPAETAEAAAPEEATPADEAAAPESNEPETPTDPAESEATRDAAEDVTEESAPEEPAEVDDEAAIEEEEVAEDAPTEEPNEAEVDADDEKAAPATAERDDEAIDDETAEATGEETDWAGLVERAPAFFAVTHPAVVHFPIALWMLGGLFVALGVFVPSLRTQVPLACLLFGTAGAVAGSATGWWYADEMGYEGWRETDTELLIVQHRWWAVGMSALGVVACVFALVGAARRSLAMGVLWRLALVVLALGGGWTGHLGGEMTYGEGFLEEAFEEWVAPEDEE